MTHYFRNKCKQYKISLPIHATEAQARVAWDKFNQRIDHHIEKSKTKRWWQIWRK